MAKRSTSALLWFVAVFCAHEIAWSQFGSPRPLGVLIAAFAAATVWVVLARGATKDVEPSSASSLEVWAEAR